jgi:hypothetical protein
MKILRLFLIASFLISLLAGIGAGTFLFHNKANPRQASPTSSSLPKFPGGQESIWLIAVDRLNVPTPRVEGIWLLAYIPNYPTITPLPLFPSDNPQQDTELAKMFRFSSGRKIAPEFWDFMKKHNHPVGDYIVFDEVAAVSIMNLYGGVRIQGKLFSGMEALAHIPKTWDDPQGSLRGQVAVMDSVCKSIFNGQSGQTIPGMDMVNKEIGKHILSNLNLEKKSVEWQKVISSGNHKVCDFTYLYEKIHLTSNP